MAGPFVLLRIDWTERFGQVEASVVGYVQVGTSGARENEARREVTTLVGHLDGNYCGFWGYVL